MRVRLLETCLPSHSGIRCITTGRTSFCRFRIDDRVNANLPSRMSFILFQKWKHNCNLYAMTNKCARKLAESTQNTTIRIPRNLVNSTLVTDSPRRSIEKRKKNEWISHDVYRWMAENYDWRVVVTYVEQGFSTFLLYPNTTWKFWTFSCATLHNVWFFQSIIL